MNMSADFRQRRKIPFQAHKEVTIPPKAVCGFGFPYGSSSAYQYEIPNDQTRTRVDPIQVGPTG